MGKVYSVVTRPFRNFNVVHRTDRILSREKPIPAPHHPSDLKQKEVAEKLKPDFFEVHNKKDPNLDDRLKAVFVESINQAKPDETPTSTRPLPQDRSQPPPDYYDSMYNCKTPITAVGKCSLKEALRFINDHSQDPEKYTVENISQTYKLDKKVVEDILNNFIIFQSMQNSPDVKISLKTKTTEQLAMP